MQTPYMIHGKRIHNSEADYVRSELLIPKEIMVARTAKPEFFIEEQKLMRAEYPVDNQRKIFVRDLDEMKTATCLRMFDSNGDLAGHIAVSKTGEIISLLKKYGAKVSHFMDHAFANAILIGGNSLDCFDCDSLGPNYCQRGFIPICKIKFSHYVDKYNMASVYGEPDIIFYFYCGDPVGQFWNKVQNREYLELDRYPAFTTLPYVDEIQERIGVPTDDMDYEFAHNFRNMVWGLWNAKLKEEFWYRPHKLVEYILSDDERLMNWMRDYV